MDLQTQTEIEAAAFRALRDHLAKRTDVQNIDMMNLAGFCRNCLSRWYQEAAEKTEFQYLKIMHVNYFMVCHLVSGKIGTRLMQMINKKHHSEQIMNNVN